jgi:hypothetical protein
MGKRRKNRRILLLWTLLLALASQCLPPALPARAARTVFQAAPMTAGGKQMPKAPPCCCPPGKCRMPNCGQNASRSPNGRRLRGCAPGCFTPPAPVSNPEPVRSRALLPHIAVFLPIEMSPPACAVSLTAWHSRPANPPDQPPRTRFSP